MVEGLAVGVHLGLVGAAEAVGEDLDALAAASPVAGVFPLAGAGELIEDEAGRAGAEHGPTVGALVVLVAVGGVLVLEVSVLARALDAGGLGDLECASLGALDEEGVVALFHLGGLGDVEHEAVGAQLLGHGASVAVIVLVALLVVGVETILGGALELGGGGADEEKDCQSVHRCCFWGENNFCYVSW